MKKIEMTRRQLLRASAALGFATAVPLSLGGCNYHLGSRITASNWRRLDASAPVGSITPRVTAGRDGSIILSWLEPYADGTAAFWFSHWRNGAWAQPRIIAEGLLFSRDRAAAPGIVALSDRNLIA